MDPANLVDQVNPDQQDIPVDLANLVALVILVDKVVLDQMPLIVPAQHEVPPLFPLLFMVVHLNKATDNVVSKSVR